MRDAALAHAWANINLTEEDKQAFVARHGLDSWNDPTDPWERRGTEHVAETLAWALNDHPTHIKWVETHPGGSQHTTYRILSIGIDVDTLTDNFHWITGQEPQFRHPGETTQDNPSTATSPELSRMGG